MSVKKPAVHFLPRPKKKVKRKTLTLPGTRLAAGKRNVTHR